MVRRKPTALLPASLLAILCLALVGAAPALADTGDIIAPQHSPGTAADGWQAGVCNSDLPECSPESPHAQFSTQAAAHPAVGFTQFTVKQDPKAGGPIGVLKDVRVDLPAGLSVNPQVAEQCALGTFESNPLACPPGSVVGTSFVTAALGPLDLPAVPALVYDLVPSQGEPALFGFEVVGSKVYLKTDIDWSGDYHEGFTIAVPEAPLGTRISKNRLVFNGSGGFLTNPSTCFDPAQEGFQHTYSTFLRADSVEVPNSNFPNGSTMFESPLPAGVKPTGCDSVPFKPGVDTNPGTSTTDSATGSQVEVTVPADEKGATIANSNVQTASVSLSLGMGLNPAAAAGLVFCEDAQLGKGTRNPVSCPANSKIGTISIQTPPLPANSLNGTVYLGKQLSRNPESGDEYRVFADAESSRYGISVRLIGKVAADRRTGRLTATFADNPQVPFTSFQLDFDDGAKAVLTSPPTCGPNTTNGNLKPYSGNTAATPTDAFTLTKAPGGGPCAKTMASRPFAPAFSTRAKSAVAGAFSPFAIHVSRNPGQQEVKGVDVTLPAGITGKLKGVPYCPQKAIDQAAKRPGASEAKNASCPDKSQIGVASIVAGSGGSPITIKGKAFLAGPYKGAPLSLAVITPATAGPFDLGTVVVMVALYIEPESARIRPVSDPIPDVFGGAKLSIRSIDVNASKKDFIVNPTSCGPLASEGAIAGGGADPTNPAAFSSAPVSAGFQTSDCKKLKFRPKLLTRVFGSRKRMFRTQNPKFRATLISRNGDANLNRTVVKLPRAFLLDQEHIKTLCTRPQQAAGSCPKASIYGHAAATSPLLGKQLRGPVYLVPSTHVLPDLLVELRGQVTIRLRASTDTKGGRLRNIFTAPDVPVSKFVLTMNGGKKGLLQNNRDLCIAKQRSSVGLVGQNGKKVHSGRVLLRTPACHHGKKKRKKSKK